LVKPILFSLKLGMGHKNWTWDKDFLRGKIEMHRSQPLINFSWSLTTEQPVLWALSSQNVHLLTYPVKKNIQDVIWWNYIVNVHNFDRTFFKMLFSESPVRVPGIIKNRPEADLGLS
jgi:hypothetical protein